jgi:pseudouridine synthase
VRLVQRRGTSAAVELGIHEGRNRQVRRMFEAVGHPVIRLVRTRIGPVSDRRLTPGKWRALRPSEVRALYEATTPQPANGKGDDGSPD